MIENSNPLFTPCTIGDLELPNRLVMAPLTRGRAGDRCLPNEMMAEYYRQRASAGLIISEATHISPQGRGWVGAPGIHSAGQMRGWQRVTEAVHAEGGRMFLQLWHMGRASHPDFHEGASPVAPSAIAIANDHIHTPQGKKPYPVPRALEREEIPGLVQQYVAATKLAQEAGFDGVEIHGANGYLIEQFLNANVNTRTDGYGGSIAARNRFALEVARATVVAIGAERVGIRLSPYGVFNGTAAFPEVEAQYLMLVHSLSALGLLYVHLVDHSSMGAPPVPADFKLKLRTGFDGLFILSGGFDHASAEQALVDKRGDLIAFGRPFLANPDLVARMRQDAPLNAPDEATFYVPGAKGYTDYPALAA